MPSQHWNPRPWLMEESHALMVTLSSGPWTVWGGATCGDHRDRTPFLLTLPNPHS